MSRCVRVQRRLPGLVDRGELGDLATYRHVRSCPRCQGRLAQYRELRRTLRALDPDASTPPAPPGASTPGVRVGRSVLAGAAGLSGAIALALALRRRTSHA